MTFLLDDTVAATTANSYCDVAYADAYLAERGADADAWTALDEDTKARRLVQATRLIDRCNFDGVRYDTGTARTGAPNGQALKFPRDGDTDSAGSPFVIEEAKIAACEVALLLCSSRGSLGAGAGIGSLSLGSMSASFDGDDTGRVDNVIRQWLGDRMAVSVRMV